MTAVPLSSNALVLLAALLFPRKKMLDSSHPISDVPCGDGGLRLRLDQACLFLDLSLAAPEKDRFRLEMQSLECLGCPMQTVWTNDSGNLTTHLAVNTTAGTAIKIIRGDLPFCDLTHHFGMYGLYNLTGHSKTGDVHVPDSCALTTVVEPENAYLPILWLFILLSLIHPAKLAFKYLWGKRRNRDIQITVSRYLFFLPGVASPDLQRDLADNTQLLPESIERQHQQQQLQRRAAQEEAARAREEEALSPLEREMREQQRDAETQRLLHSRRRYKSLDVFRGISVAMMIFVNYGGGKYPFFKHSIWNGLTVADLPFPFFVFIMGTSLAIVTQRKAEAGACKLGHFLQILRRTTILLLLGLCLNSGGKLTSIYTLRVPGVLQRFAFCYFCVATVEALYMKANYLTMPTNAWWAAFQDLRYSGLQWAFSALFVSANLLITFLVRVPDCPTGYIGPGGMHEGGAYANCTGGAARYVDHLMFGDEHLYQHPTPKELYQTTVAYDPEGMTGGFSSLFLVGLGAQAGRILVTFRGPKQRTIRFLIWSVLLAIVGGLLCGFSKENGLIPVNKNLWSLSYVLVTGSMSFFLLALMYVLVDWQNAWNGTPFLAAGINPILLYIGHEIFRGYLPFSWSPLTHHGHGELLFMSMWGTLLWLVIAEALKRARIQLSVWWSMFAATGGRRRTWCGPFCAEGVDYYRLGQQEEEVETEEAEWLEDN